MEVLIDGVRYVPAAEVSEINDKALKEALYELTAIQYFSECSNKHRAWAWDALNALAPELAKMDSETAYEYVRRNDPDYND